MQKEKNKKHFIDSMCSLWSLQIGANFNIKWMHLIGWNSVFTTTGIVKIIIVNKFDSRKICSDRRFLS